jgi:hypothetical protein
VAQLGARLHGMQEVAGSIPASSTKPSLLSRALSIVLSKFDARGENPQVFFSESDHLIDVSI